MMTMADNCEAAMYNGDVHSDRDSDGNAAADVDDGCDLAAA